ncbi:MAG: hypothetical protein E7514_06725 [Ruminococcaceae bacterium]|nr:hypothetical protein [Oscillospiraceae bacterium]
MLLRGLILRLKNIFLLSPLRRRDDDTDNLHSLFVDQWDWCRVISPEERNEE